MWESSSIAPTRIQSFTAPDIYTHILFYPAEQPFFYINVTFVVRSDKNIKYFWSKFDIHLLIRIE